MKRKNSGFSLVELIIVIAIMAVLIAVLAPQYISYVEKTKTNVDATAFDNVVKATENAIIDPENKVTESITLTWDGANFEITGTDATAVQTEVNGIINGNVSDNSLAAKSKKFSAGDTITFTNDDGVWSRTYNANGPYVKYASGTY